MAKPKIKHTITRKEWNKKHKDFKLMGRDGIPYIMMYDDKIGTHLVPVKIIDESVNKESAIKLTDLVKEANVETYHKSFTHAAEAAKAYALKKGYDVDEDDWQSQVAFGGKYSRSRPGVGKSHSFSVGLLRNGKPQRKALNFSVYGMESGNFELTAYVN
jgi:hypothetical protein